MLEMREVLRVLWVEIIVHLESVIDIKEYFSIQPHFDLRTMYK